MLYPKFTFHELDQVPKSFFGMRETLLILILVLLSSGNPAFLPVRHVEWTLLPAAILLAALFFGSKKFKVQRDDLFVFGIFLGLTLVHVFLLKMTTISTALGFFVRLFIAFSIVRITKNSTFVVVHVIAFFAAMALTIFMIDLILNILGLDLVNLLMPIAVGGEQGDVTHVVFHNFHALDDRYRNAGIFWEPGALAGYCLLALILWGISTDKYSVRRSCAIVIPLVGALITTFSTTGYVLLPFALLVPFFSRIKIKPISLMVSMLVGVPALVFSLVQIAQLPFVEEKISDQLFAVESESTNWQLNRIGQLLNDTDDFFARPLTGWGANPKVTPSAIIAALDDETQSAQGNGLSRFIVEFGMIGFGAFIVFGYRNFTKSAGISAFLGVYAILMICLLLSGEMFLNYPLFLSLMFASSSEARALPVWVQFDYPRSNT